MVTDCDDSSARGRSDSDCSDKDAGEGGSSDENAGSVEDAGEGVEDASEGVEESVILPQKRKYKPGRTQDRTKEWEDHELFGRDEFTAEAFEEIKRELSEDGNGWTKGNAWTAKSGTGNYIMEWRCGFKNTLSCPCVFRVEHVRAQYGVTVIRKRMGHAHLFKPKFKDSRFPWSVLNFEISEDRRICCDWHDRRARFMLTR